MSVSHFFPTNKTKRFLRMIKLIATELSFQSLYLLSLFNEPDIFPNKIVDQSSSTKSQEKLVCVPLEIHDFTSLTEPCLWLCGYFFPRNLF